MVNYKKDEKELYGVKTNPQYINVKKMSFIMVDGSGDPNNEEYAKAVEIIYALTYTIKMSKMKNPLLGYYEYTVYPLEGLWWTMDDEFSLEKRDRWLWTSMLRQPDFVNEEIFKWAVLEVKKKKPNINVDKAYFKEFEEKECVQILHVGPYKTEPESLDLMHKYMDENNLIDDTSNIRKHHEIYLSDPRKVDSSKLKTIMRHPVRR